MNGNLLEIAAAYNAGPGNLSRWLSVHESMHNDPLLFIESIPVAETRNYVKRLMTYHWMYRRRLEQKAPTLDETAAGEWPRLSSARTRAVSATPSAAPEQSFRCRRIALTRASRSCPSASRC